MTALCLTLSPSGEGVDLKTAQKNFNAAQARHDKENATLERLQEQQADKPSDALATKVEAAEVAMQSAVEALEHAEEELARVKKLREIKPADRCKGALKKSPDGGCP